MSVALVALWFNHGDDSGDTDAMMIRRNLKVSVILAEWEAARCIRPEDSPAAYAIKETYGNQLTLRGKFRVEGEPCMECGIQAVPGDSGPPPKSLPPGPVPTVTHANVLVNIPPTSVSFGAGGLVTIRKHPASMIDPCSFRSDAATGLTSSFGLSPFTAMTPFGGLSRFAKLDRQLLVGTPTG